MNHKKNAVKDKMPMKQSFPLAVFAVALMCAPGTRAATTIDLDGPWYTGSAAATAGTPSFSPNNTSDTFTWGSGTDAGGSSARRGILWTYFDEVALANNGDFIRVSFTAQWPTAAATSNHGLRFGLFDNGGSTRTTNLVDANTDAAFADSLGYFGTINLGSATGSNAYVRHTGNPNVLSNQGTTQSIITGTFTNANATAANTAYDFSLQITRNSATEYGFALIAASGGITTTTTAIATDTFNTFYLLNTEGPNLQSIQFSNFEITYVPEPGAALLGGLGLLALLRRRRAS